MSFEVTGLAELMNQLEDLEKQGTAIGKKALKESASIVEAEIIRNTPKSATPRQNAKRGKGGRAPITTWRSGEHLQDNIGKFTSIKMINGKPYLDVGVQKGGRDQFFYSKFLEWGTSTQKGTHFVEKSVDKVEAQVISNMEQVIVSEIKKVM